MATLANAIRHDRRSMRIKHPRTLSPATVRRPAQPPNSSGGFSLLEILVVLAIILIMLKIALPSIKNSMTDLRLGSSATSLAAGIQSARYQAISTGCTVQVSLLFARTAGLQTYQLSTYLPTGTPPACAATFSNYINYPTACAACPVPFTSSDVSLTTVNGVVLSGSIPSASLFFNPNGTVSTTTGGVAANFQLVLSPSNGGQTKTVNVSGVGYVKVTAP